MGQGGKPAPVSDSDSDRSDRRDLSETRSASVADDDGEGCCDEEALPLESEEDEPPQEKVRGQPPTAINTSECGVVAFQQAKSSLAHCMVCGLKVSKLEWKLEYRVKPGSTMSNRRAVHVGCAASLPAQTRDRDLAVVESLSREAGRSPEEHDLLDAVVAAFAGTAPL